MKNKTFINQIYIFRKKKFFLLIEGNIRQIWNGLSSLSRLKIYKSLQQQKVRLTKKLAWTTTCDLHT